MIKNFSKIFGVNIPATTMSRILGAHSCNKILKQDNVEAFNKRIRECKYPDLEKMLYFWHGVANSTGISISNLILIEKLKSSEKC